MQPNMIYRAKARAIMKVALAPALLVALLASLPSLLAEIAMSQGAASVEQALRAALMAAYQGTLISPQELISSILSSASGATMVALGTAALSALILPFLNLGFLNHMLHLVRNEEANISDVLSRKQLFLKAILQTLLRLLKLFLWELPGMGVMFLGMLLGATLRNATIMEMSTMIGMCLSFGLAIRAMVMYYFAEYLLADHPEMSVRATFKESIRMVKGRNAYVLSMLLSFIVLSILTGLVTSFVSEFSDLVGSMLSMAVQLVINIYSGLSFALIYEDLLKEPSAQMA